MASIRRLKKDDSKSPWVVTYTDPDTGKRIQKTPKSGLWKDADKLRQKVEREIADRQHTPQSASITIAEAADRYVEDCERRHADGDLSRSRLHVMRCTVRARIKPLFSGSLRLCDLAYADVEAFRDALAAKGLGRPTRHDTLKTLGLIEAFGRKRGWTKKSIASEVVAETARRPQARRIRTFDLPQVMKLLQVAHDHQNRVRPRTKLLRQSAVNLAALCGLRYGEIMGLTLDAIDLDERTLYIRHSLNAWDELKGPKTSSGIRDVGMPAYLADLLREWIDKYYLPNDRHLVFRLAEGGMIRAADFHTCCWRPLLRRAELLDEGDERFHFHALRHFNASWRIERGESLMDVASALGHATFDMTLQTYAHPIIRAHRRLEIVDATTAPLLPRRDIAQISAR